MKMLKLSDHWKMLVPLGLKIICNKLNNKLEKLVMFQHKYITELLKKVILKKTSKQEKKIIFSRKKINENCYLFVETPTFYFSVKEPNNICFVGNEVIKIEKILRINDLPVFVGAKLRNLKPLFEKPLCSDKLNIYKIDRIEVECEKTFDLFNITNEAIILKNHQDSICIFPFI